jgi:hypothetical protein
LTDEKLLIKLGQPEHGWLPVELTYGEFELQFTASDIPVNPIDQLISGIKQITKGISTQVWWHLEPEGYYFHFEKGSDIFTLRVSFARNETAEKELIFETKGNYDRIIMPFYRCVKNFFSKEIEEVHWPVPDKNEIDKLVEVVNER